MSSLYLSAEDCECNSKGRYWSIQLDTNATNLRKSLCVPVTCSPSHIHLTIHLHSVSSLTLSLRYLKTAPRHLFDDDTLALLSSHFCPMLRALDSHIASSTYSTVIVLQVSCYYTRLCIPTSVCWGKGQMNMTSRAESKREMAQEAYALSKQILPALPRRSLLKKQSRKHLQKQMLPDEPMFSMDINKGCRKAHNEMQTKAKSKWQKPIRTTMDGWRSELTEVCKQCKGKSNRKISGMLTGWRDKK